MIATRTQETSVLLMEPDAAARLGDQERLELLQALLEAGHPVARRAQVDPETPPLAVLSRVDVGREVAPLIEISGRAPGQVVDDVSALRQTRKLDKSAWTPWFPVIDYDRCTNCMQCLSFCLFDVYGADENGKIEVRNEDNCKTNCPACSRVCPDVAILFPKYAKGPINGDVVRQEDLEKESMKVDISALLGGDIYSALRDRSEGARKRFSTERDESKALLERKRCLKALKKDLDIPDEVLMSLPSAGDIEDRARRAKAKMERRRAISQTVKDDKPAPSREEWGI